MTAPHQTTGNQQQPTPTGFRDERFTATYLDVSVETLRSWRKQNRGPRYRRIGRCVRYSIADLLAFVEAAPTVGAGVYDLASGPGACQSSGAAAKTREARWDTRATTRWHARRPRPPGA
jgi:Helix-turn-helix domain